MATPNWGLLAKSQVDDETIEEAINRIVGEHNSNEESHLEVGQSLQSHKASEIIDHLALSIVTDKIGDFEITREKLTSNKHFIDTHFESQDAWVFTGGGGVDIELGNCNIFTDDINNSVHTFVAPSANNPVDFGNKNPVFEINLCYSGNNNKQIMWGIGYYTGNFAGFYIYGTSLVALWYAGGSGHTAGISGIDITQLHRYRVVVTSGTNIKFYVDGVLKYTATTYLPTGTSTISLSFYLKNLDATDRVISVTDAVFFQDL